MSTNKFIWNLSNKKTQLKMTRKSKNRFLPILVQASLVAQASGMVQASAWTRNCKSVRFVLNSVMFFMVFSSLQACGQDKVESNAYQFMLQKLLSHSVEETLVSEVDKSADVLYLDAREKEEYEVSHINNSIWVGYDDFNLKRVEKLNKDSEIIVYCSVGYRSEKISERLKENGFTNVSNLYGGIFEWKNQDHSVVNLKGEITDSIHAFDKTWGIWLKEGKKVY